MLKILENYRTLVAKVDRLCRGVEADFGDHLACRKGCDACCRHITLFWVEGVSLALALEARGKKEAARIRSRARRAAPGGPCPLLDRGLCLLYEARPLICRTQGLPLLAEEGGERRIDFCPKNFHGVVSLPAAAVIDLEVLNATLATLNAIFVREWFRGASFPGDRLSVAKALLLDLS